MLERVSDPGSYQAFQHFITDAPWSTDRVWRQLRAQLPERSGMLTLDGQLPEAGPTVGRYGAPILQHAGQGGELPSRGDDGAVDGRARMDGGGRAV
jgi:hypothetical protein